MKSLFTAVTLLAFFVSAAHAQDTEIFHQLDEILATRSRRLNGLRFGNRVADQITAFLLSLTDDEARDLTHIVPDRVPSGLAIDRLR